MWLSRVAEAGYEARLPRRIVEAFFPRSLWIWAEELAALGPSEASAHLERFCRKEALRSAPVTRARPLPGPISAVSVDTILAGGRRLFGALSAARRRACDEGLLEGWEYLPPRVRASDLGAQVVPTDRRAPGLEVVREALVELEQQIRERRPGSAARRRALRDRALVALLVCTGARIGAISRLRIRDFRARHVYADGALGQAIVLHPGKALSPYETRVKGLPVEVAGWIGEYLESLRAREATPIFPAFGDPRCKDPMNPSSLTKILAGESPREDREVRGPLLRRPHDRSYGYSAHTLRHLAERLAYAVGRELIARQVDTYSALTPQAYADALLDHEMRHDHLGYKDQATTASRELLARDAAIGIWRIVREGSLGRCEEEVQIDELRARRRDIFTTSLDEETDHERLSRLVAWAELTTQIDDLGARIRQ